MRRHQPRAGEVLQHQGRVLQVPTHPSPSVCILPQYHSSHDAPYYVPHRGGCVCYSGDFICAKEDYTKAFKKDETPVPPTPLEGVYLYLGFSKKDARVMMDGRKEVGERF